jgi:hypothetical protein
MNIYFIYMSSNSKSICRDFSRGTCRYGNRCKFLHAATVDEQKETLSMPIIEDPLENFIQQSSTPTPTSTSTNSAQLTKQRPRPHQNKLKKVNTETFDPSHAPADMRLLVEPAKPFGSFGLPITSRDVIVVPGLFCESADTSIYEQLMKEMNECGIKEDRLWKMWHGDNHLIADDHQNYKERVPTFMAIIQKIREYFKMDIKATRFNWYRNDIEWKPFHHDASAVDPEKAKIQNFTVGVSFGATRDIAFEDALESPGHRRVISIPLVNGTTYCFSGDINTNWRHGVPQLPPEKQGKQGRISIIAWGFVNYS